MVEYSIIVPVYNVEKYLERCVNSILNQTYKNFELILVNDGSTDNSASICDYFQKKDYRIKVIHKRNYGVSSARNVGLDNATGKYIVFVDSDDFIDQYMLDEFNKYNADLVVQGFKDYDGKKFTKVLIDPDNEWYIESDEDIIKFLQLKSTVFVWGKKFKKEILNKFKIRFKEDMKYNEDMVFNNDYLLHIKSIVSSRFAGYYHCQYETQTLTSSSLKDSFTNRNRWRLISYNQFIGHKSIQEIYAKQLLYFAEKEISTICKSDFPYLYKKEKIISILFDDFFQKCIKDYPRFATKKWLFFYKHKLVHLLLMLIRY